MPHHPPSLYDRAHAAIDRSAALLDALRDAAGDLLYCGLVGSMVALAIAVSLRLVGIVGGGA